MSDVGEEPDLGALLARVFPRLIAMEEPILQDAGLSMWEYTIVTELAGGEAMSQVDLSRRTRRDPTRLGRHLDELAARGLVSRERASDQRQRAVLLTDDGHTLYRSVKQRIRAGEDRLLGALFPPAEAARLRRLLGRLAAAE